MKLYFFVYIYILKRGFRFSFSMKFFGLQSKFTIEITNLISVTSVSLNRMYAILLPSGENHMALFWLKISSVKEGI